MTLLAHTQALIVDLRGSGDGAASMVNLLSSFFFGESVHLNTVRGRPDEPEHQNWTPECVQAASGSVPLVAVGRLNPFFDVFVPVGRSVHPRSGEPIGAVDADIAVPADRALEAACAAARVASEKL